MADFDFGDGGTHSIAFSSQITSTKLVNRYNSAEDSLPYAHSVRKRENYETARKQSARA